MSGIFSDDRSKEAHSLKDLNERKGFKVGQGEWRKALAVMAERIMNEPELAEGDPPHPKPKNPVWKAAYNFLKNCETGEISYIRELANRLDGLPAQSITFDDKRSLEEMSDAELDAAGQALLAIVAAQTSAAAIEDSAAGEGAPGEIEPAG